MKEESLWEHFHINTRISGVQGAIARLLHLSLHASTQTCGIFGFPISTPPQTAAAVTTGEVVLSVAPELQLVAW